MVHFLENHDEQRIASPFFAGDYWKGAPALVISALIDRGPMMIYFGQEVGEPGAGSEGFGGEDGRTTIYDYWGVPQHQKWVNGGKYDGGALSADQKQLRQFYSDVLTFAATNKAIANGDYYDLTKYNLEQGNISDKIHVFARVSGEERLIILSGFEDKLVRLKIKLSDEVAQAFQMKHDNVYVGRDLLRSGTDIGLDGTFTFETDLFPHTAYIFKIKE